MASTEVDSIILPILRQTGCKLPESISSFAGFESHHVVRCCSVVLAAVDSKHKSLPLALPEGKAGQFRVASKIANAIDALGFSGEAGYQTFLYPNEHDLRQLFLFLVDKLPKTEADAQEEILGSNALLNKRILSSLTAWSAERWNPFQVHCAPQHSFETVPLLQPWESDNDTSNPQRSAYLSQHQPLITQQTTSSHDKLAPSLLELHTRDLALQKRTEEAWQLDTADTDDQQHDTSLQANHVVGSAGVGGLSGSAPSLSDLLASIRANVKSTLTATSSSSSTSSDSNNNANGQQDSSDLLSVSTDSSFARKKEFGTETGSPVVPAGFSEETEEETQQLRDEELAKTARKIDKATRTIQKLADETDALNAQIKQLQDKIKQADESKPGLESEYKIKKKTLDLLPNAESNMAKLLEIVEASKQRLLSLEGEWKQHQQPLQDEKHRLHDLTQHRKDAVRDRVAEVKALRSEMKSSAAAIRSADGQYSLLIDELNRLPKSVNRNVYVKRIMDIMRSLDKQKVDIKKILSDVRNLQKDIGTISDKCGRTFAIVDEMVFTAAAKNKRHKDPETATQFSNAYKYLVRLRECFDELVGAVEKTGQIQNDVRDMEQKLETEKQRASDLNAERLADDLKAVKTENKQLVQTIKKTRASK